MIKYNGMQRRRIYCQWNGIDIHTDGMHPLRLGPSEQN
jgi:hypothetical protein